ncbi:MAG: hypothetical protein KA431_20420, partial [Rubrivivax sp.]|nr:hypothetical protein [Rubrivivax sp.]
MQLGPGTCAAHGLDGRPPERRRCSSAGRTNVSNCTCQANLKPTSRIRETRDYSKIFLCGQTLAPQVAASGGLDGGLEYVDNCGPPGASMRFFGGSQKKMSTMSLDLWQRGCERLAAELPEQQFNTWIRPLAPT